MRLRIDTETYSETPIKRGTYRYVEDCELMIVSWAIDDGPVSVWDLTSPDPTGLDIALSTALMEADVVIAHNAVFDRGVIAKHFPKVTPPLERWQCSMAHALSHSLPGGLDKLCEILGVPLDKAKHKTGKDLVRLFCMPRPSNAKIRRATRDTHPQEWERFLAYAGSDIDAMREIEKRMPSWNYQGAELALWHLDQRINDRGFAVDLDLANAAIRAIDEEQTRLAGSAWAHTDGALNAATQRDAMLEYILTEFGIALPDLRGSTIERRLKDPDLPDGLKELLSIRLQASTTSTSKYLALVRGVNADGRMRGTLQFNGAGRTGRWAGRTFQPQNLPRPSIGAEEVEDGITAIKAGVADLVTDNVMELTSNTIRGCIVAPPGRKLVVADLSNIEGRMLAWLAGETWKLKAFDAFDHGEGVDLYIATYARTFRVSPEEVTKSLRQIGKVMELAFGYEGGVGAWVTFALVYGIDLEALAALVISTIPKSVRDEAEWFYEWTLRHGRSTFGLSPEAFVACDAVKRMWRENHPATVGLWRDLEQACIDAVINPGTTFECGKLKTRRDGAWLRIGLPSGRALCYPQPKVEDGTLSYMGVNQYTRQWSRINTYGGKLVENVTQAAARDVLAANMPDIDRRGYGIVLTVHDEIITETPDSDDFAVSHLSDLMSTVPAWAKGLPLAAAGFEGYRYRKD